ncbi:hypothetical protein CPC08DRAFT_273135 [Agrocybe pediades]|nr:hypothetical protein CPC08DRAFT_273135 [Agrocybe pediades]
MQESRHKRTSIDDLPVELLSLIFEWCYEDVKLDQRSQPLLSDPPWHFISGGLSEDAELMSDKDRFSHLRSRTRFPFTLADVSKFWEEILSTTPAYWSQIIFHLDSASDVLDKLEHRLLWSANLPLDIVILGRVYKPSTSYRLSREAQQLSVAMKFLVPHIHRCRSILVETRLTSTLSVAFNTVFAEESPDLLSSVCFLAGFADAGRSTVARPSRLPLQSMPLLTSLALCGKDFYALHGVWLPLQTNLHHLVISNCHLRNLNFEYVMRSIHMLENLDCLKLKDILFKVDPSLPALSIPISILTLHLDEIAVEMLQELFRLCEFDELDELHIARSFIPYDTIPSVERMVLEDIPVVYNFRLELILAAWDGLFLWLGDYKGSTDSVLDALRTCDTFSGLGYNCHWLEKLFLYRLPSVSLKKLKKLIKRRNQDIDYADPNWRDIVYDAPVIHTLSVVRCDIVPLTQEDIGWFQDRVKNFTYVA